MNPQGLVNNLSDISDAEFVAELTDGGSFRDGFIWASLMGYFMR